MVYICEKCRFAFERAGRIDACPDCGGMCVRDADDEEAAEYRRNRAELSNEQKEKA